MRLSRIASMTLVMLVVLAFCLPATTAAQGQNGTQLAVPTPVKSMYTYQKSARTPLTIPVSIHDQPFRAHLGQPLPAVYMDMRNFRYDATSEVLRYQIQISNDLPVAVDDFSYLQQRIVFFNKPTGVSEVIDLPPANAIKVIVGSGSTVAVNISAHVGPTLFPMTDIYYQLGATYDYGGPFSDIGGAWYSSALESLQSENKLFGFFQDGTATFRPNAPAIRSAVFKMVVLDLLSKPSASFNVNQLPFTDFKVSYDKGTPFPYGSSSPFPDAQGVAVVNPRDLLYFAQVLKDKGIVKGYSDGSAGLRQPVTRAEMAAMLVRALEQGGHSLPEPNHQVFNDVPPSFWAYADIQKAYQAGFIKGYPDGTFRPNATVTRAEAEIMAFRASK